MGKEKLYLGGIAILYRKNNTQIEYLVVENAKTGNITFVAGAKEDQDKDELETIERELKEELGLEKNIELHPTSVRHEFIFGEQKKDRAGCSGSYQVFLADVTNLTEGIYHTKELKNIKWMSKDEVLKSLTFEGLKEVFIQAIKNI
jgi:8-oxo-dGTP pyrophosphatase MutT (NUDIX family)